jgi:hypothetical protein
MAVLNREDQRQRACLVSSRIVFQNLRRHLHARALQAEKGGYDYKS